MKTYPTRGKDHSYANSSRPFSSLSGICKAPPPFQLKASGQPSVLQKTAPKDAKTSTSLGAYNNANPKHDPSHLTDAQIKATAEYKIMLRWYHQTLSPINIIVYQPEEILLACRLMLRDMRSGMPIFPFKVCDAYLKKAHKQLTLSQKSQSLENKLNWSTKHADLDRNGFGDWLMHKGPKPTTQKGTMNCWEFIMFCALELGFTTKAKLKALEAF